MKQQSLALPLNNADRVKQLSILPIFMDLHGKRAVVIGGVVPSIWKAELLAKAGAKVKIICNVTSAELLQFVSNLPSFAKVELAIAEWQQDDFSGVTLVVADVPEDEAALVFAAALKHTSMVNVIDKPKFCTFQFGSIVNRSPLVIGISTTGAAPVLAQHVHGLLETFLPPEIQAQAQRAADIRESVNTRLGSSVKRRSYWNAFFGKGFGFREFKFEGTSKIYDIAATSIEDLTLRDIRALQAADRIYFEKGADKQFLQFGRREAERIQLQDCRAFDRLGHLDINCVIIRLPTNKISK